MPARFRASTARAAVLRSWKTPTVVGGLIADSGAGRGGRDIKPSKIANPVPATRPGATDYPVGGPVRRRPRSRSRADSWLNPTPLSQGAIRMFSEGRFGVAERRV